MSLLWRTACYRHERVDRIRRLCSKSCLVYSFLINNQSPSEPGVCLIGYVCGLLGECRLMGLEAREVLYSLSL